MTKFNVYKNKAENLVKILDMKCNEKTIKENYGQEEIRNFVDEIKKEKEFDELSYSEQTNVIGSLNKVSYITDSKYLDGTKK